MPVPVLWVRTWWLWDSRPQLIWGPRSWWDHAASLLPDGHPAFGEPSPPPPDGDLPVGQGHPGSFPRTRAGGVGCPQLRAAFHPLPGRSSLSVTCCPPGRRPRARGQGRCARRGRSARTSSRWRGGTALPRQHPAPCAPLPAPRLGVGIAGIGPGKAPVQRQRLHALSLRKFPLPSVAAIRGRSGGADGWVLLEHTGSVVCVCPGTLVSVCHGCEQERVHLWGDTHTQKSPRASLSRNCMPVRLQHLFCCSLSQRVQPNEPAQQS